MSRVEWIKIVTDIFEDEKITIIENMDDGDAILNVWFRLLCFAGKQNNNGVLMFNSNSPYTPKMLAVIFHKDAAFIEKAIGIFKDFGMVDIIDGVITIPNWEKHQNADALEKSRENTRLRVQKFRQKQRELIGIDKCQYCGGKATGVDHIIALARGGSNAEDNTVPCCMECNRIKNDKPLVDFLNSNRDRINDEIVTSNEKLKRFVTLSNVTNRYIVTQGNGIEGEKDIEIDKDIDKEIDIDTEKEVVVRQEDAPQQPQKQKRFVKPSLEDVKAYCAEIKSTVDPDVFYNYYEANGWKVGNRSMKDWKAAIRYWGSKEKKTADANLNQRKGSYFVQNQSSMDYADYEAQAHPSDEDLDDEDMELMNYLHGGNSNAK